MSRQDGGGPEYMLRARVKHDGSGGHVEIGVFMGVGRDRWAYAGTLRLRPDEWEAWAATADTRTHQAQYEVCDWALDPLPQ